MRYQKALSLVVICFHFSNFEPLETAQIEFMTKLYELWFAFILVTLSHWKQHQPFFTTFQGVVICFHFSNFEPLETAGFDIHDTQKELWFAFILVTLSHWKQLYMTEEYGWLVVICFHFSNFEPLETAIMITEAQKQSCDLLSF